MGRGRGGSRNHDKRTPGGIGVSSKMSKVGEIEVKNGVLGDQLLGSPERVEASNNNLDTTSSLYATAQRMAEDKLIKAGVADKLEKKSQEMIALSGGKINKNDLESNGEWRKFRRKLEQDVRDYIKSDSLNSNEKQKRTDLTNIEYQKLDKDPVVYNKIDTMQELSLPSDRTSAEINERFEKEAPEFLKALPELKNKDLKAAREELQPGQMLFIGEAGLDNKVDSEYDENDFYKEAGFVGKVFSRALKDETMRELFLKLRANSQLRRIDDFKHIEHRMARHIEYLLQNNKPLEKDSNHLDLDVADPLNMSENAIMDIYYYKTLMSNPETREMVKEAYNNHDFKDSTMQEHANSVMFDMGIKSSASDKTKAAMKKTQPAHRMGLRDIDDLRASFGETPVKVPSYVSKVLEGQPMSQKLYALVKPDYSKEDTEALYLPDKNKVKQNVASFDQSEYGKRNDFLPLTDLEKDVLVEYTLTLYQRVNGYMRQVTSLLNNYQETEDPDIKKAIEDQMEHLMTDPYNIQTRIISGLVMDGLAKIMVGNKGKVRAVTRGSSQPLITTAGLEAGKYFYDPGVNSTTIKENWASPWGLRKTQLVLVTDKYVDARPYSRMQDQKEDEMMIFPGTMFKADMFLGYKTKHGIPQKQVIDAIIGREVSVDSAGNKKLVNIGGNQEKREKNELIFRDKSLESGKEKLENYQSRFKSPGGTLYHWLYKK